MKDRKRQLHAWYLANRKRLLKSAADYRQALRSDPVAWAVYIEKARLYKRRVFGWKRTYRPRKKILV